jgi:hypothetical protein
MLLKLFRINSRLVFTLFCWESKSSLLSLSTSVVYTFQIIDKNTMDTFRHNAFMCSKWFSFNGIPNQNCLGKGYKILWFLTDVWVHILTLIKQQLSPGKRNEDLCKSDFMHHSYYDGQHWFNTLCASTDTKHHMHYVIESSKQYYYSILQIKTGSYRLSNTLKVIWQIKMALVLKYQLLSVPVPSLWSS